jgi:hypothetical protein
MDGQFLVLHTKYTQSSDNITTIKLRRQTKLSEKSKRRLIQRMLTNAIVTVAGTSEFVNVGMQKVP